MIKFNSDNIFVGFIKQLLSDTKIPTPKIYIKDEYCINGQLYIKDNFICRCIKTENTIDFKPIEKFLEQSQTINFYKTLKFTGINYDSHTHEYLGEYLRYLRDYKNLNLMSLYNCYSNSFAKNLYMRDGKGNLIENSDDGEYKYIIIPAKLNSKYTIAIDCSVPYRLFATLYGRNVYTNKKLEDSDTEDISSVQLASELYSKTVETKASSGFSSPYVYDKLESIISDSIYSKLALYEDDLKLVVKLPISCKSSVVVLEGNYVDYNDYTFKTKLKNSSQFQDSLEMIDPFKPSYNNSIINFDPKVDKTNVNELTLKTRLQLLEINSGENYAFADRLKEYLVQNAITQLDQVELPDNIKRLQKSLYNEWVNKEAEGKKSKWGSANISHFGIWDDTFKLNLYNLAKEKNLLNTKSDILGYVDKDVEANLGEYVDLYKEE